LWVLVFRALQGLSAELVAPRPLAGAVLATAVLGTALNDGGVTVWLTLSAAFALSIGSLWIESRLHPHSDTQREISQTPS
jgi:hypothetical protein